METRPIYSESSSDTESDSNEEEDDESETDAMVIDEQDLSQTPPKPELVTKKSAKSQKHVIKKNKSSLVKRNALSEVADDKSSEKSKELKLPNTTTLATSSTPVSSPPKQATKKKQATRNLMLTGRGVTTQMLIDEHILEPGEKALSINYLGRKFVGDLIEDGTILCHTANQVFSSPSAWAMYCKKQVNPDKKSGCGWASVKYKGRKLDEFKSTWFRKQKIEQQVMASSENDSISSSPFNEFPSIKSRKYENLSKEFAADSQPSPDYIPPTDKYLTFSEALKAFQNRQPTNLTPKIKQDEILPNVHQQTKHHKKIYRKRISVKHSSLQPQSDPTTLVECAHFTSTGKIQPFSITISTSALLLIDFHCHLVGTDVSGYLAGKWDSNRQHIRIVQSFPCKYTSSSPMAEIQDIEDKIRSNIEEKNLILVGWYHSHPFWQPDPSINDINAQLEYQKVLKDGHYEPCVGLIVAPYDSYRRESTFNAFWVRESTDGKSLGLPLQMKFTTQQEQELTQQIVNEMVNLVNFYQSHSDVIKFSEIWSGESTFLDKLKHSVIRKFPQNQTDGRFLDFIHKMLAAVCP